MNPKDAPICCDFALLVHEPKEQKKLIKYSSVIGLSVRESVGSRLSYKNPLENLQWYNPLTDAKGWAKQ